MIYRNQKTISSDWWIAVVLFVISILISTVPSVLYGGIFYITGITKLTLLDTYSNVLLQSTGEAVQLLGFWLGVKYASRYIQNKYELPRVSRVTRLVTLYMIVNMILNFVIGIEVIR